jgi:hypothetical protein
LDTGCGCTLIRSITVRVISGTEVGIDSHVD